MSELADYVKKEFRGAAEEFEKDLNALAHEALAKKWGESERTAYDYVYEVAIINHRLTKRLKGEDPGPMPWAFGEEWLKAPAEHRSKERAMEFFKASAAAALEAIGDDVERKVKIGDTEEPVYQLVVFGTIHMTYHDAQLNFIQAMSGDMAVHW